MSNSYQSNKVSYPFLIAARYRAQDRSASARKPCASSESQITLQQIEPSKRFRFLQFFLWFLARASFGLFMYQRYERLGTDDNLNPGIIQPPKQPPFQKEDPKPNPDPSNPGESLVPIPKPDSSRGAQLNILADIAEAVMPSVVFIESDSTKYFL